MSLSSFSIQGSQRTSCNHKRGIWRIVDEKQDRVNTLNVLYVEFPCFAFCLYSCTLLLGSIKVQLGKIINSSVQPTAATDVSRDEKVCTYSYKTESFIAGSGSKYCCCCQNTKSSNIRLETVPRGCNLSRTVVSFLWIL